MNYDQAGGLGGLGVVNFAQNTRTYYTTARVDAEVTKKLRVYGSWLYQLAKQYGENLPNPDSSQGLLQRFVNGRSVGVFAQRRLHRSEPRQ